MRIINTLTNVAAPSKKKKKQPLAFVSARARVPHRCVFVFLHPSSPSFRINAHLCSLDVPRQFHRCVAAAVLAADVDSPPTVAPVH